MTEADLEALRTHKPELLTLLRDVPCLERDGTAARLPALAATLTPDDRGRLDAEAAAGDVVARVVLEALAEAETTVPEPVAADMASTVARALREAGWIVVYSTMLAAEVIFVRDADVSVPEPFASLPRFDRDELTVLAAQRPSADRLRAIVDAKREMPGARAVTDSDERLVPAREVFPATTTASATTGDEPVQGRLGERRK